MPKNQDKFITPEKEKQTAENFPLTAAENNRYYFIVSVSFPKETERRFKELGLIRGRKLFVVMKTSSFFLLRLNGFYLPLRTAETSCVIVKNAKSPYIG